MKASDVNAMSADQLADELAKLKHLRESFQEMLAVAKELEHCIDRGYIDLPTKK